MASDWEPVIGLEVHAHLKTKTKMFCRCALDYGAPANTRTCPVCLAHPGSLPVANGAAIESTIRLGLALGCRIPERAVFARKNYFYPDLPKGYQISQYEEPLCVEGALVVPTADGDERVGIERVHLEEDAAKTVHAGGATGRSVGADYSLVDFNRGGTPLVEIVTRPDLRSAEQALRFLRLLRQTIVELGVSDAEMEKGTLRADVNVSLRRRGEEELRPRMELKNMNSFTFIGRGIEAAVRRQTEIYEEGATFEQSTYDYDPDTDALHVHRSKEEADDYRYFPEPDLVPVAPTRELLERIELPELPGSRIARIGADVGIDAAWELVSTGRDWIYLRLRESPWGDDAHGLATAVMNDFPHADAHNVDPSIARVIRGKGELPRDVYAGAISASVTPTFNADEWLAQRVTSDESELEPVIERILAANVQQVETYRSGKEGVLGFLVGQVMRETGGKADPKVVNRLLREKLAP